MNNQMSREQAALNMLHLLNMDEGRAWNNKRFTPCEKQSFEMAIAALRHPVLDWVRTADRLPTEEDAIEVHDEWGFTHKEAACLATGWPFETLVKDKAAYVPVMMEIETIKQRAKQFPYWMPLPKLPEVEG